MSRMRTNDPSGFARTTMCPNSSTSTSRPWVWMLSWNNWSSAIGWAPVRPTAACTFWPWIAWTTSFGVIPRLVRRSVSSHTRML